MTPTGPEGPRRIVLDTSAYSWLRAGHEAVLDAVAAADIVWLPAVVVGELEAGFELGSHRLQNSMMLEEFLSEPFVSVLPVTREVSRRYGRVFAALRRAGTPIPINDVWIAAATLESGGTLVTFDRHFEKVTGLEVRLLDEPGRR